MDAPEEIKKLRKELKLNQEEMAEKLGIGNKTYWLIEAGKRRPSKPVQKLLDMEHSSAAGSTLDNS